ncbi:membrane hypothetical protein [Crenothrix polyspora]|uniref:Uncharacterized protein n=1 Tax=Crenothrix polyspora TaxID=360316 RepID=A0A1R4H3Q8_9GAMM|nr:membrane hypothetical protein [Crenothrix polyspora]
MFVFNNLKKLNLLNLKFINHKAIKIILLLFSLYCISYPLATFFPNPISLILYTIIIYPAALLDIIGLQGLVTEGMCCFGCILTPTTLGCLFVILFWFTAFWFSNLVK